MPPQPTPQPASPLGAAGGGGSRAGTPTGGLAELREAQESTADAVQLVAEEVERQGHAQTQMAQGLAGVQLQVEALPAVLEERFAQLEGRQAVTDRRLAAVEQRLEAGERRAAVVQSESSASSLTALPDTAALPAVRLQERAVVPTAAARPRQASTAAAAAAAAAGAAADGRSAAELPPTSAASSATPLQQPGGHRIRIGDHCFASMDDVRALIKQLKCDLLDRPIRSDAKQHGPIFRFLEGLLSRHPKGAAKVQHPPVKGFVARVNGYNSGVEFRFIDACNREHDFSTQKCLKQREASPTVKLARAMAAAVQDYKTAFWWSCAELCCTLCGADDTAVLVVDHDCPTFPQLRAQFMAACPLPAPRQFVEDPQTNAQVFSAEDGPFVERWRQYHKQQARLRLLCVTCLRLENKLRGIPHCKGLLLPD